jgi:hypothetical protein
LIRLQQYASNETDATKNPTVIEMITLSFIYMCMTFYYFFS